MMDYEKWKKKVLICGKIARGSNGKSSFFNFPVGFFSVLEITARPRSFLVNCVFVSLSNRD